MTARIPPLDNGDVLTRVEFERRYAAMPELKKAELVEGVVFMGSPVRLAHGQPEHALGYWLGCHQACTRGLVVAHNATVRLDLDNVLQPDLLLRIPEAAGGRSRIDADDYISGPPELVVEVAASSVSRDLHGKKQVYRRSGVLEYLVHRVDDGACDWFLFDDGVYVPQAADAAGVLKSRTFPGLWLDVPALLRGDLAALRATVERGVASDPAHGPFAARLRAAAESG